MIQLRPYQVRAIEALRASYTSGHRRPLLVAPTGSGKTVIAAWIIESSQGKGHRSLFVAPRRELIGQTVRKLADAGVWDVRVIQAAHDTGRPDAPVTVGSIQTLILPRWRDRMPEAGLVIADEAHHMVADEWSQLGTAFPGARWLGLTATPERGDGRAMGDMFDDLIVAATVRELTDLGNLVPMHCSAPAGGKELKTAQLAIDVVEAYQLRGEGRAAVVFSPTILHAEATAASLCEAGISSATVTGKTKTADRERILAQWRTGEIRVVCNVGVLTEGFDYPELGVVVLARRFQHAGLFLQCVGRALRSSPGKAKATLIDLCGSVLRHGPPDAERSYSLSGKAISGVKRDAIRQCPGCGAVFLAGPLACPTCGLQLPRKPAEMPRSVGVGLEDLPGVPAPTPIPMLPIEIDAKYSGRCRVCGGRIRSGDRILWGAGQQPSHVRCPDAETQTAG